MQQQRYTAAVQFKHKIELYHSRYSKVWACNWQEETSQVVLKAYFKSKMRPRHLENVRRELDILGDLCNLSCRCNGIVGFLGSFEDTKAIYIVQEHCSCGDLFATMHKCRGCLSEQWVACQVIAPLLQTLEVVHQRGVIHRDIKPENLFLTEAGVLRLGDWGLAINQLQEKAYSRVGTLDYMAPEVGPLYPVLAMPAPEDLAEGRVRLQDISGYTEAVDVWGVGVLTYELMAGRPPFEVSDAQGTADLIMHGQVQNFPMACSADCISFIKQALIKTPEQRPSATQLLRHAWLTAYTNSSPPQLSIGPQTPRQTQEGVPSHNYCLGDVPLHDKLTGTSQPDQQPVSMFEAADNTLPSTHGVQTSTVGVPLGLSPGSSWSHHGEAGMHDDCDWAIQAWAEEQPAAVWMSQEVRQQFLLLWNSSQRRNNLCGTENYSTHYVSFEFAWHPAKPE
ncbi:MAG: serine threonine kinase [Trebouxia sp. A1-2]|nr:MAG: serine threonine kinase [Trebouxia sp. A1-2]